jgi:histidinol-phosphate/aromatic aminotransferase/cobyric acid decarboxylase-like protein/adenosyl cobinamide kinase/adenosyl cobinamide phosphate guanylyltransferase
MGRLTLVLGGQKSGKSSLAARRAMASDRPVAVVTPAVPRDPEFAARVDRHRADRPAHWRTLETFDLVEAVTAAGPGAFVLVDALDTWLAESMESSGMPVGDEQPDPQQRAELERVLLDWLRGFAAAVAASDGEALMIAGQPGLGVHAGGPGARAYVALHGLAVQVLSEAADEVLLVVGGRVLPLVPDVAASAPVDLESHGDRQVPDGTVDLAVNVEPGPPEWLRARLAETVARVAAYPDERPARAAIAARHGRAETQCLPLNGAAEAFWLIAHGLRPRLAACVQPSFTEPEVALRAAGVPVIRVHRPESNGWLLDPAHVPDDADLVVLGRPDNPTGALDPVETVERLARPGRTIVVDEAFAEFLDDASGMAVRSDVPGLVVVRSLTKLWGLAGLRVGYLVGPAETVATLRDGGQPWNCNSLALGAIEALAGAEDNRRGRAANVATRREALVKRLSAVSGIEVWASPANFLLLRGPEPGLRDRLLKYGLAARRADTFPGLDDKYVRVAVRDAATNQLLVDALRSITEGAEE